jgi:hypothetical protein
MGMRGQLYAPAVLLPRKSPRNPLDASLGGPQSRSGRCEEKKNIPCPSRKSNPGRPASSPSLCRLIYRGSLLRNNLFRKLDRFPSSGKAVAGSYFRKSVIENWPQSLDICCCPDRNSNQRLIEYKCRALPLPQPARWTRGSIPGNSRHPSLPHNV